MYTPSTDGTLFDPYDTDKTIVYVIEPTHLVSYDCSTFVFVLVYVALFCLLFGKCCISDASHQQSTHATPHVCHGVPCARTVAIASEKESNHA